LNLLQSPYLLLFLSLACFTISLFIRKKAITQTKKTTQEGFRELFRWLSKEELEEVPSCIKGTVDLLFFYKFCLKQKNLPILSPVLESRWVHFSQEHAFQESLCDFFIHANAKMQQRILLSFKFFPLWKFQAFCLAWMLREKKDNLLKIALGVWADLPFDEPWSFSWLALAFSEEWDKELLVRCIHPELISHIDSTWSFSEAFNSANVKIQEIHQAFLPLLSHHETLYQDLGIYGLGFFKCSSSLNALVDKLYSTDHLRLTLLLRSIAKLHNSESLKQVSEWAKTISYPDWELMEEVLAFYASFDVEGVYWIEQLKTRDHFLWNNFFKNSPPLS
jgi:hypothetical protein